MGIRRAMRSICWRGIAGVLMVLVTWIGGCAPTLEQVRNQDQAQQHYLRGVGYLNLGAADLAVKELRSALEFDAKNAEIYNALGLAYHMQGKHPLAAAQFEQATRLDPRFSEAHLNYSALLLDMEQWDKAIVEAEKALANPAYQTPERAYHNLGVAYYQKGLLEMAASYFQKALRFQPDFPYANYYLGRIYLQTGRLAEAIQEFNAAIQRDPTYVPAYYQLGLAYYKQGERQKAEKVFRKVMVLAPRSRWAQTSQTYLEQLR
ncbi:MAG: tetratricopeptide repeat protein [Nitrospinota bacterium]|nr:MAG: tetratricopeptide repeat protein [Nitrospinota bacterium]